MMRALDLFCCAGGASAGLVAAGYDVTGVDIDPQPEYPFRFVQADALTFPLGGFDLIWASPPCQRYSMYSRNLGTSVNFPDLIAPMRERLRASGSLFIIENVIGAPLICPALLCGTMFGLKLLRHRLFETNFHVLPMLPSCSHKGTEIPVYGNGTPQWHRQQFGRNVSVAEKRAAMGIDWMSGRPLSQAIPPAYAEYLGRAARMAGAS